MNYPDQTSGSKKVHLKGRVEHITYQNKENGYVIARLMPDEEGLSITIVGTMPGLKIDECIEIEGVWEVHQKYGRQLKVEMYKTLSAPSLSGIEAYLASGVIYGIGPGYARKIVNHFKGKTLEILDKTPERVMEVKGVGKKKGGDIIKSWKENKLAREVMMFLQEHAISPATSMKIIKEYGDNSLNQLKDNPYRLADDIFGIGFKKADVVAQKLGVPLNDPRRLEGAIKYILSNALNEGHCFLDFPSILERGGELINLPTENVVEIVDAMIEREELRRDGEAIYLPAYYVAESQSARRVAKILASPPKQVDEREIVKLIEEDENRAGYKLNEDQRNAIVLAINSPFMILTGGPGTGKSTAMHFLVRACERIKKRVLLACPTGRAAKRLEETTGRPAYTIHRLLEYHPKIPGGFQRNEHNPLDGDLLIIDEASMVDIILFHHLLKAVPVGMQVLFVGDPDQLPSVGPGNVLANLLSIREIDSINLTQIFRQAEKSMIVVNAHRINSGKWILISPQGDMVHDFRFIFEEDPDSAANKIVDIIENKFSSEVDPIRDIQVLSPMHNGSAGARNLNRVLQDTLNPSRGKKDTVDSFGRSFRIGDRVMQIKNNYEKEVFNGDVGFVERIDSDRGEVGIMFDRLLQYKMNELDEIQHAYAVTIHKSQGSEYPVVIMPILTQHYMMLRRNLLYTGITRAKRLVVIVGSKRALNIAISRDDVGQRNTNLEARIRDLFHEKKYL